MMTAPQSPQQAPTHVIHGQPAAWHPEIQESLDDLEHHLGASQYAGAVEVLRTMGVDDPASNQFFDPYHELPARQHEFNAMVSSLIDQAVSRKPRARTMVLQALARDRAIEEDYRAWLRTWVRGE